MTARWVVYEYPKDNTRTEGEEVSWHKTGEKAVEVADARHAKTGLGYRVDLLFGTGGANPARWECLESEPDIYGIEPKP